MRVQCKDNSSGRVPLTVGAKYEVQSRGSDKAGPFVRVVNDKGELGAYSMTRFKEPLKV